MTSLTPERRAELRRTWLAPLGDNYSVCLHARELTALLDAADERDRLLTVADTLGRVNGEYAMEIHRCREALGVDEDTDPSHAAKAVAGALARVMALAEQWRYKGEFGWGAWQEGHGPDETGWALDHAAGQIRNAIEADDE